jgi:nucleotidyltransferase/DNA polymerase involved in DNA repair
LSALPSSRSRRHPRRGNERQEEARRLRDLWSVGPAIERDLNSLGVQTVTQLARRSPERLYRQLERTTGKKQDPCVLDTFRAAVAQALDPDLPVEQCVWWHWSGLRRREGKR